MLESYLSAFLVTFIISGSAALLCFCVVRDALIKKWSIILIQSLIFASLNGCVFSACVALWGEDYYIFMYGVCILCGWQYLYKVTKENRIWLFFLICMTFSFLFFCASVSYLFYTIWMPEASSDLYIYEDVLFFGSPLILFWYPFYWYMRKLYLKVRGLFIPHMWRLCILPVMFSFLLWLQSVILPGDMVGVAVSCILKGFIVFCSFLTYSQMSSALNNAEKAIGEQERRKFLAHQFDLQKTHMEDLEAHAEEMRRIRHDRRQHVEVLKGLLARGDVERAREYLQDYEDSISKNIQPPLCCNFAADTICSRYQALAKQSGIKTILSLSLSKNPGVSGSDLAVILGNLWENAIAAALDASSEQFIRLKVVEKHEKIFIRMENNFGNIVLRDDGRYLSTKAGRNYAEGIGLSSIKAAAAKYGGIAEFSHNEDVFTSSILLYPNHT